jgi:hypothetical protein
MSLLDRLKRQVAYLDSLKPPSETPRHASMLDLPFPMGYGGLPRAQVEAALAIQDKLGVRDPVLRKYSVLSRVRGYLQSHGEDHGPLYDAIVREQQRLGDILAEDDEEQAEGKDL